MNNGFFSSQETSFENERVASLPLCGVCSLKKKKRSKTKPYGQGKRKVAVVTDAFVLNDQGGLRNVLYQCLKGCGLSPVADCLFIPVTNCTCSVEKSTEGTNSCRPFVLKHLEAFRPKLILCFGINATTSVIGHKWKKGMDTIDKWRGYCIPDHDLNCFVCPVLPISESLCSKKKDRFRGASKIVMRDDLRNAIKHLGTPFYDGQDFKKTEDCIHVLNEVQGRAYLKKIQKEQCPLIAFDYETNCLKPYGKKARLYCVGIADGPNHAVAFTIKERETKLLFRKVMRNKRIRKIAANMKFEETWTRVKIKTKVLGWIFDTVLAAHIEDQRGGGGGKGEDRSSGTTSVKFQACVRLGIYDYSSKIHPYLQSKGKGGNDLNTIRLAPMKDVLFYCGMDGLIEYRLGILLAKKIGISLEA